MVSSKHASTLYANIIVKGKFFLIKKIFENYTFHQEGNVLHNKIGGKWSKVKA